MESSETPAFKESMDKLNARIKELNDYRAKHPVKYFLKTFKFRFWIWKTLAKWKYLS